MTDPLFSELSEKLRVAHRRVATLEGHDEQKSFVTRRLLAITNTSKHDLGRASQRLDALLTDLDAGLLPIAESDADDD